MANPFTEATVAGMLDAVAASSPDREAMVRPTHLVRDVPRTPSPHGDKVQRGKLREQALQELRYPRGIPRQGDRP